MACAVSQATMEQARSCAESAQEVLGSVDVEDEEQAVVVLPLLCCDFSGVRGSVVVGLLLVLVL